MSDRYQNATVIKQANVYFDGKCVSHTVLLADGTRKTLGVLFPSTLTFTTAAPERMEILTGRCRVRQSGATNWLEYTAGQAFDAPGDSSFDIETLERVDYVCHFG